VDRAAATAAEAAAANVRAARRAPTRATVGFPPGHRLTNGDLLNGREDQPKATGGSFIQDARTHTHANVYAHRRTRGEFRALPSADDDDDDDDDAAAAESADGHAVTSTNDDILLCRRPASAFAVAVLSPLQLYTVQNTPWGYFPSLL